MEDHRYGYKRSYFDCLTEKLNEMGVRIREDVEVEISRLSDEIYGENTSLLIDPQASFHLFLTALILATYRYLKDKIGDEGKVLAAVRHAFLEPSRRLDLTEFTRTFNVSPHPFADFVTLAKEKETATYGKSFIFVHEKDDDEAFHQHVTRCFYHDFFNTQGVPQLTAVFCSHDFIWMDAFRGGSFGFAVERPTTLGEGGDKCRFEVTNLVR